MKADSVRLRAAIAVASAIVLGMAGYYAWGWGKTKSSAAAAGLLLPLRPYAVTLHEHHIAKDGSQRLVGEQVSAARSDGATMYAMRPLTPLGMSTAINRRHVRFVSGDDIDLDDVAEKRSTRWRSMHDLSTALRAPASQCLDSYARTPFNPGETLLSGEVVSGYRTARIAKGSSTQWLAVDLSCALMRQEVRQPDGTISRLDIVDLVAGEPPPALFAIPPRYDEVAPSVLYGLPARSTMAARVDHGYNLIDRSAVVRR